MTEDKLMAAETKIKDMIEDQQTSDLSKEIDKLLEVKVSSFN